MVLSWEMEVQSFSAATAGDIPEVETAKWLVEAMWEAVREKNKKRKLVKYRGKKINECFFFV